MHNITMKAQSLFDQHPETGLDQVYSFMSKLAKTIQLEYIVSQIEFISQTSWKGNLTLDRVSNTQLKLHYWTRFTKSRSRYLEFKIEKETENDLEDGDTTSGRHVVSIKTHDNYHSDPDLALVGSFLSNIHQSFFSY